MIAERLKFLRKNAGITQVELAKQLNVATSTLAMWETERREPDFHTAGEIADFFGVTVDYLLGRDEKKEPTPVSEGGPSDTAQQFMPLVDKLTPGQQQLLLVQLQAWTEQNGPPSPAAPDSGEEKAPGSDS